MLRAVAGYPAPPGGGFTGSNVPYVVAKSAIPFIHISTGSIGNNGALTAVTALPTTYPGAYCYYPTNSISAATPAGWYWTVFSSATAGTIFNNTYAAGVPAAPTSPTAFATTGPGAFTGDTTARDGPTITVPAGSMGPNGQIRVTVDFTMTNNGNNKTAAVKLGGTSFLNETLSSDLANMSTVWFANRAAANSNYGYATGVSNVNNVRVTAPTYTTIDTTAALVVVPASLNKATATDNMVMERFAIEIFYGA